MPDYLGVTNWMGSMLKLGRRGNGQATDADSAGYQVYGLGDGYRTSNAGIHRHVRANALRRRVMVPPTPSSRSLSALQDAATMTMMTHRNGTTTTPAPCSTCRAPSMLNLLVIAHVNTDREPDTYDLDGPQH